MPEIHDNTPTWVGMLPILIAGLEDGSEEGRTIARAELRRMAEAADLHNASVAQQSGMQGAALQRLGEAAVPQG